MGVVNRIINILVLLFAILAVVFAFMLFNKRERLVSGWDEMASAVSSTAKSLDANSGTKLGAELDQKNIDHKKYENLAKVLPKLSKGASDVVKERDSLAEGIKDIATKLEIPVSEDDAKALKELANSEAKKADIKAKIDKVQERNQGIVTELIASAKKVNITIDEAALKDTDNFREPLNKFNSRIDFIKKQTDTYGNFVSQIASILGAQKPNLTDAAYASSLSETVAFVNRYKANFETTKRELVSEKNRSRELKGQLESKETELASVNEELKKKDGVIANLNKLINPDGKDISEIKLVKGGKEALKMIKGQVVEINPKWDFVVINVGNLNQVTQKIGQRDNVIPAPLPADKNMTVSRGLDATPEFVGKIHITRVYDYCAIANVLSSPKGKSDIKVGDTVFFADEDLASADDAKKDAAKDAAKEEKKD